MSIPGYSKGAKEVGESPISNEELDRLRQTVLLEEDDKRYLRLAGETLEDQVEDVLDVWYGFVASHPYLVHYFSGADGQPNQEYLAAVRKRFGQWIRDVCSAEYDREWLDYQQEIAFRHTPAKKNRTDQVQSAASHVSLRYIIAFIVPITATIRPFLSKKGRSADEVEKMYNAWFKAVTLHVTLWSQPYAKDGLF